MRRCISAVNPVDKKKNRTVVGSGETQHPHARADSEQRRSGNKRRNWDVLERRRRPQKQATNERPCQGRPSVFLRLFAFSLFFLSLALRFAPQSSHMLPLCRINTSAAVKDTQALLLGTYARLGARDPDEKI